MNKDIKFYIPFEGFYNSIYDSEIDSVIDGEIEEGYIENDDNIDYNIIYNEMSEHIFDTIEELFNDEFDLFTENSFFKYDGLSSPKYYNYSTDKIMAKCSPEVYLTILNHFKDNDNVIDYINKNSKSRDGFVSFYDGYNEVIKDPAIYLQYLFEWFVLNEYRDEVIQQSFDNINEVIYNNL